MPSGITLKETDDAAIPTPATNKVTIFVDDVTGEPSYKDDTGTVTSLQAPGGAHATSHQNGGGDEISVAGLSGLLADGQTPLTHATSHQNAGGDEISVAGLSGELADAQPVDVRKNSTGSVFKRSRLNLIEGTNVTLTVADDAGDDEVDITIAASGGGSTPVWVSSDPRTPPGSPSADDHEFLNGDTIGGTTLGSPGTAPAIANNRLVITGGTSAGADMKAKVWTAPSTPYKVTTRAQIKLAPNTFHVCSVFLRSSVSAVMVTAEILRNSGNFHDYYIGYCKYSALTTRGANAQTQQNNDYAYLRVEYDGTNITVSVSTDGNEDNWHTALTETVGTTFTGGNLPDQFGLGVDSLNGGVAGIGFFDYVRVT